MKASKVAIMAVCLLPFLSCNRSLEPRIDGLFTKVISPHSPGAAVTIVHHDQIVHAAAFGTRDVRSGEPITLTTNFRLASLTKQFTAMAVLILMERGALGYDDPLTVFSPEFPDYGRVITVHHLLTHTSGLKDYEGLIPAETTVPLKDRDVLTLLTKEVEGDFPPGSRYHYSNSGYALLALIVEQVSGLTFADFLRTTIFSPLDMTATVAFEKGISTVPERAFGHTKIEEGFSLTDQSITSSVLGDGGIYSSVTDLMKWDRALYSDQLVTRETMETAFRSHVDGEDRGGYGYGWFVRPKQGRKLLWHHGSTIGFRTAILRIPEIQLTVIVLANRNDIDAEDTAHKIMDWTLKAFY